MQKILGRFIKKHTLSYIIGILFMLLTSYIQTLFPRVLGNTIDILGKANFANVDVYRSIVYILLIAIGSFATTYAWRNLVIGNARSLECTIREELFSHFQKLSPEFYNRRKTGDLIAYAINDINAVRMTFGPATAMAINGIVICGISIYSMANAINWRLTLLSLIPIPFIVFFMMKIGGIVRKRFKKVQENFSSVSGRVQENITGIRVIKAYVQEDKEVEKFELLNDQMVESNLSMIRISAYLSPLIEVCFTISFVLNLVLGGNMVMNGSISLGDFIAFNGYLAMILGPVISIGRVITIFQRGMASLTRLNEILSVKPDIKDGSAMVKDPINGPIEIRNLSFSYPGSADVVLSDIDLTIPKGYTIGVVGKTGSGKSTLVNLLLKMYNIENDKIILGGIDINDYQLKALRDNFGLIPQDNFLFHSSIRDNIKFFNDAYSDDDVIKSSQDSCIYESIMSFPSGLDTILGERGVNLSGGQKQRISIARALIKDPEVLILDDALCAVDTITEAQILENIKRLRENKSSIIIAHRISAVKDADIIIVLDKGSIVEKGTHQDLIEKGGAYYEIYKSQYNEDKSKFECQNS